MSISVTFFSIFIATAVGYIGLILYILRLDEPIGAERWMAVYCLWSVAVAGALALNDTNTLMLGYAAGLWLTLASIVGLCLLGIITFSFLELPSQWAWGIAAPAIVGLILIGDARDSARGLAELTWQAALAEPGAWLPAVVAAVWAVIAAALLSLTYYFVTQAGLPLLANRRFWWVIALFVGLSGEATAIWGTGPLTIIAQAIRLAGVVIAVYATTNLELIDIRGLVRTIIGNALFVIIMTLFIIVGIAATLFLVDRLPNGDWQIAAGVVAVVLAIIYQRVRPIVHQIVLKAVLAAGYDTAQIVKGYSQRIASLIDIGELAVTVGLTMAQAVQSTKLGLLLLTADGAATRAEVLIGAGKLPTHHHTFDGPGTFLQTLTATRRPLSQYAIDYDPKFKSISADDRAWLRDLGTDTYVPVFDGEVLNAVIAVGPRQSHDPYRQAELDLLSSLADQTSVALKNARLVANLRLLNDEMRSLYQSTQILNKELGDSNERLRQMDKVKTDFLNIASHELRTPLTKIKGFSDIMNDISGKGENDAAMLEMATLQISRACTQLEEVIGQMLDVSQLDVEALQLIFSDAIVPTILQNAADHFKRSIITRKQTLLIHDMHGLPPIRADYKRLVQTFRQLIGNAIKFTPDGGRIDVYANYLPANEVRDRPEAIEIVVADTGVGVNPEHQELIFEKFYRVGSVDLHSTGDTKFMGAGPGLGLTIARGVIKAHHGQIWVESDGFDPKAFPGSQFHVVLPVKQATQIAEPASVEA